MIPSIPFSLQALNRENFSQLREIYGAGESIEGYVLEGRRPCLQSRRLMALWMIRQLLHEETGMTLSDVKTIWVDRFPSGAPYLRGRDALPGISISHSGSWVACVLCPKNQSIGLDIEDMGIQRDYHRLADYAFSEAEGKSVKEIGVVGFYRLWTAKEALAKSSGKELSVVLKKNVGDEFPVHPILEEWSVKMDDQRYIIHQKILNDHICCSIAFTSSFSRNSSHMTNK